ncbi:MAG: argininosuccinate lyase [Bacteroidota bacterium]|nr:argininosuccinate lyase [Odoribacter sp.]MDP3644490.1 argininosuccinate lyase [Bacteroidota bacterium]
MKLWDKGTAVNELIENFTVGKDREMDLYLAKFDVLGSIAHAKMLQSIGLLTTVELAELQVELVNIYHIITNGEFRIEENVEDVHSQVELMLTRKLGDTGKKIHSGRSRNDQVLLDLKLFTRSEIQNLVEAVCGLFDKLLTKAIANQDHLMPGYTHLQVAMPSSFGLWFSAYAESLVDDLVLLQAAFKITNQNPLGSAAGYGSSFPLDRQMTTDLLGFDSMNYNVIYAQMGRGKMEKTVAFGLSSIAATISKFAFDVCLFMSQNFDFVSLPDELTTGSSIMPHKKNPDVFELVRSHCNKIQAIPYQISLMTNNLPSGYFRDLQILKEVFLPAFQELSDCINITGFAIDNMKVNTNLLADDRYRYMFSVEDVNKLVQQGVPFRDAYKQVGNEINSGTYNPTREVNHTHSGSIGNLCLDEIAEKMITVIEGFEFEKIEKAYGKLLARS